MTDRPYRLREAVELFCPTLSPSALKSEARKGNLDLMFVAGKYLVTEKAIREMLKRCQEKAKGRISNCGESRGESLSGTSDTAERSSAALDAALLIARELKGSSRPTSPKPSGPTRGKATLVKFQSRRS